MKNTGIASTLRAILDASYCYRCFDMTWSTVYVSMLSVRKSCADITVTLVRDLGVWIDSRVTMSTHISKVVTGCFVILRQLHSIRRPLTQATLARLVVSLVLTSVDYCNSVLTGLPLSQINRLQAVINATACLILSGC